MIVSFLHNAWLASSLVALAVAIPLNSSILAHPYEPVCVSCLLNMYGGTLLGLALVLTLSHRSFDGRFYGFVLKALTVLALIFVFHVVQLTAVPTAWWTVYAIICVIGFVALMLLFMRTGTTVIVLFLQFVTMLSIYEGVNVIRIANEMRDPYSTGSQNHRTRTSPSEHQPLSHIFVIVFDELSLSYVLQDGILNHSLIPNLAEFSTAGTWYRQAVTLGHNTERSIPVLLTGQNNIGTFEEVFLNTTKGPAQLFSELAQTHDVYITGSGVPYCSAFGADVHACLHLRTGFSNYFELLWWWWERAVPGEFRKTRIGRSIKDAMHHFLFQSGGKSSPMRSALALGQNFVNATFTYIHENLPHAPYIHQRDGSTRPHSFEGGPTNRMTREELSRMQTHYQDQISYTDRLFGEFLMELKNRNLYERALIVVTSDHGISFNPSHPGRHADRMDVEEVARIPLIIKWPDQRKGAMSDRAISLADVAQLVIDVGRKGYDSVEASGARGEYGMGHIP